VPRVDLPRQTFGEIDDTVSPEASHRATCSRVEADESVTAGQDDSQGAVLVAPRCHTAMNEAGAIGRLSILEWLGIVSPDRCATSWIERNDSVVRRADIEHVIDHQGRRLKGPWFGAELLQRRLLGAPCPCDAESGHIGPRDLGGY
jgi:hypothetical protein